MKLGRYFLLGIAFAAVILALPLAASPTPLFDGSSLKGWKGDSKWWKVKDGEIHGGSTTEKIPHNYFLSTEKTFSNFELKLKIKLSGDPKTGLINSGIQICSVPVPESTEMSGYQVDAGEGWYGKLYDESRRNRVIANPIRPQELENALRLDDWNEFKIRVEGPRIRSWINGTAALDYTETEQGIAQDGHIALQIHSGGVALVQVKDIVIEELPDTPDPVTWDKVGRPVGKNSNLKEGNVLEAQPKSAAEQLRTFEVPEGFEVELVTAEDPEAGIGKFVAVHFDDKGRMWTMTALEYPVDGNETPEAAKALYRRAARDKILVFDTPFKREPQKGRVFAEGLAIPLGILPFKEGCYALHGEDLVFLHDQNGDGKADKREVILTGFGVQDSHLFPHQFTRAPGGWIWMAQGAFNYSQVRRPNDSPEKALQFDQTRMAKFRPDGSDFDITSNGPCNIWGLALTGEGEAFIQEANDGMYSVMPFHEYANYPGCSNKQWKSYAPEFPAIADFRMGGTGLSGLALTDAQGPFPEPWANVMLVANPITRVINAVKLHREGSAWRAEKLPDFLTSSDPMFRPIAMTLGPDGCVYMVDWYNKIISHNEVARSHPDRDKTRGRIWRIRPKTQPSFEVPDFTKLTIAQLMEKLGSPSTSQSHFAWQNLADRELSAQEQDLLHQLVLNRHEGVARRIQALWVLAEKNQIDKKRLLEVFEAPNRNLRRELVRSWPRVIANHPSTTTKEASQALAPLAGRAQDSDPEVRAEVIRACGVLLDRTPQEAKALRDSVFQLILSQAKAPLDEPLRPSTWHGKPIKVGVAYEREFERYLIRLQLERHAEEVYDFLTSDACKALSAEARLLAALSLPEEVSVPLVSQLLPQLERAPSGEESLRLWNAIELPEAHQSLQKVLNHSPYQEVVLNSLLQVKDRLDASKVRPLLLEPSRNLLRQRAEQVELATQLVGAFQIHELCGDLTKVAKQQASPPTHEKGLLQSLQALGQLQGNELDFLATLAATSSSQAIKDAAILTLASQNTTEIENRLWSVWPQVSPSNRRLVLDRLSTHPSTVGVILTGLKQQKISQEILGLSHIERLEAFAPEDELVRHLINVVKSRSQEMLQLLGKSESWVQTDLQIPAAFTVETWIKLHPQDRPIGNADSLLSVRGIFDINFHQGPPRVYSAANHKDIAIAKKPVMPDTWTHVAVSRNSEGRWKIYLDGELSHTSHVTLATPIPNPRIGDSLAPGDTNASLVGFRIWSIERTEDEIRATFDREVATSETGPIFAPRSREDWGKIGKGASLTRTLDLPPVLTAEAAAKLDAEFTKYRALAHQEGDKVNGKALAALCMGCHLIQGQGTSIGPDLSGVGAMGVEAILRNILTPNAAMESAYRIYRLSLKDGSVREGFLLGGDEEAVNLRVVGSPDQRIPRDQILHGEFLRRSLMPEGLLTPLPDQAVADLFTYLRSLK